MALAAVVIIVRLVIGLGFLWPLVAVAAWEICVALTPEKEFKALAPPVDENLDDAGG